MVDKGATARVGVGGGGIGIEEEGIAADFHQADGFSWS